MGLSNYHKKCIHRSSIDCILTNKHIEHTYKNTLTLALAPARSHARTQQTTIIGVNARILLDIFRSGRNNNLKNLNLRQTLNSYIYTDTYTYATFTCTSMHEMLARERECGCV